MANYAYDLAAAPGRRAAYLAAGAVDAAPGVLRLAGGGSAL
jgi:hypothetical protein